MTFKQKIDEILKRESVSHGEFFGRTFIDAKYVAKLEKLVRELGEMSEVLAKVNVGVTTRHDNGCKGLEMNDPYSCDCYVFAASDYFTRLNKLLDEMGGKLKTHEALKTEHDECRAISKTSQELLNNQDEIINSLKAENVQLAQDLVRAYARIDRLKEDLKAECHCTGEYDYFGNPVLCTACEAIQADDALAGGESKNG